MQRRCGNQSSYSVAREKEEQLFSLHANAQNCKEARRLIDSPVANYKDYSHRQHEEERNFLRGQNDPGVQQRRAENDRSSCDTVRVSVPSTCANVPDDHAEDQTDESPAEPDNEVEDLIARVDGETSLGLIGNKAARSREDNK
jgi:hypothetical protein